MASKTKFSLVSLSILILFLLTSPIFTDFWQLQNDSLNRSFPTTPLQQIQNTWSGDIDGDGFTESINIEHNMVSLSRLPENDLAMEKSLRAKENKNSEVIWQSPPDWNIKQAFLSDLNRDNSQEIVLLLWRDFRPWPIDKYLIHPGRIEGFHDKQKQSCHVILIGWRNGNYRELWAGSAMVAPFISIASVDIDQDGYEELIAIEGSYDDINDIQNHSLTVWEWNGFGFSILARKQGDFKKFFVYKNSHDEVYILTQ